MKTKVYYKYPIGTELYSMLNNKITKFKVVNIVTKFNIFIGYTANMLNARGITDINEDDFEGCNTASVEYTLLFFEPQYKRWNSLVHSESNMGNFFTSKELLIQSLSE